VTLSAQPRPSRASSWDARNREHAIGDGGSGGGLPPSQRPAKSGRRAVPSRTSLRGLDWFAFFIADVQTGFGPFIAVYLTAQAWTQVDIGLVLTAGGLVALAGQMPGGAIVDAARSERSVAAMAVVAISLSALMLAVWPIFAFALAAKVLHSAASCVLGPAMAAISLGLVGHAAVGERLGRNARFASIGNGLAAAAMGACGYLLSNRAVFFLTAILIIPALVALARIRTEEIDPVRAHGGVAAEPLRPRTSGFRRLVRNRPLLVLAGCAALFHVANAAMLPLLGSIVTMRSSQWATVLIAACIVVPQLAVAAFSPWVGRQAQRWGRRPLLLIGLAALPIRGLLFALVTDPLLLVLVQLLDGITGAALGVLVPLIIADATRGSGRFNLAQGIVGSAVGIGAALSTTLAGYLIDHFGSRVTFLALAAVAAAGLALAFALMPETRPKEEESE
jgi:predicted MFS family arabinose efflux permease